MFVFTCILNYKIVSSKLDMNRLIRLVDMEFSKKTFMRFWLIHLLNPKKITIKNPEQGKSEGSYRGFPKSINLC